MSEKTTSKWLEKLPLAEKLRLNDNKNYLLKAGKMTSKWLEKLPLNGWKNDL